MRRIHSLLFLYIYSSLFAQQPQVPEIQFDSVLDSLKLPADLYLGEVAGVAVNSKKHIFVLSRGNTTGPAYGAAAAQLLEFDAEGRFQREIGHNLYAWSMHIPSRSTRRTTSGWPTRAPTWSSNSIPRAA
jgi:hypothetical protein